MQTFTINIIIYKLIRLQITPWVWYLWPVATDEWYGDGRKKIIEIHVPGPNNTFRKQYITRTSSWIIKVSFLCFELQYRIMRNDDDVANIYPEVYDCVTDREWRKKYDQLAETGYFA